MIAYFFSIVGQVADPFDNLVPHHDGHRIQLAFVIKERTGQGDAQLIRFIF